MYFPFLVFWVWHNFTSECSLSMLRRPEFSAADLYLKVIITTIILNIPSAPPSAPTNLTKIALNATAAMLAWEPPTGNKYSPLFNQK